MTTFTIETIATMTASDALAAMRQESDRVIGQVGEWFDLDEVNEVPLVFSEKANWARAGKHCATAWLVAQSILAQRSRLAGDPIDEIIWSVWGDRQRPDDQYAGSTKIYSVEYALARLLRREEDQN
jgi:hypothetical protein